MAGPIEPAFLDATAGLSRIRREIGHADLVGMGRPPEERERGALTRAQAYVWLAALMERFVRDAIQAVLAEINATGVVAADLRTSLFALLCEPQLESIRNRKRQAAWQTKVSIFDRVAHAQVYLFSPEVMPLDGRTLRGEHFDTIWLVFGFPDPSLPTPQHRVALRELADRRNDVAHGNVDPIVLGRSKTTGDVLQMVGRMEDVVVHFCQVADGYLAGSQYRR